MTNPLADAWRLVSPAEDDPLGRLPSLLLVLTVVTGLVDAFSYLALGRVFVANMTGNVVFLGFALAGAPGFSIRPSLAAYAAFAVGSLLGGRLVHGSGAGRSRRLAVAAAVQTVLVAVTVGLSAAGDARLTGADLYAIIGLLGVTMGLQNAVVRSLAVPDLTTTVLTLTTTGIFADSGLVGGPGAQVGRRTLSIAAMVGGAVVGAALIVHATRVLALVVALVLLALVAAVSARIHVA